MADLGTIPQQVSALRRRHAARDQRAAQVRAVRHGDFDLVAPNLFDDDWPRPIVANRIDVFARHMAAALSPLPTLTCPPATSGSTDAARKRADLRTKAVLHYFDRSRVQAQMMQAADQFWSYGLIVTAVEPDFEECIPSILMKDPSGFYPVWDQMDRTVKVAHVFTDSLISLMAEYPQFADQLRSRYGNGAMTPYDKQIEIVRWDDDKRTVVYVSDQEDLVLFNVPNVTGRCRIVATQRPGLDDEIRGAFDDAIWVQLALHAFQKYTLSAVAQSVNAPVALPLDATEFEIGPGAVVKSSTPEKIRRVPLDLPPGAWTGPQYLAKELEYGSIVPEALGGAIDASVVTGKGVQQLMAGYSQQIAMAQESLRWHFEQVASLALETDEKFWPDKSKSIRGTTDGAPFSETYRPGRDIAGDYSVEVQYGGFAGLDPNRSLVALLQALSAKLVSREFVQRNLPAAINPSDEDRKIRVEEIRDGLTAGMAGIAAQFPQLALSGQNPGEMLAKLARAIAALEKGEQVDEVLTDLYPPPQQAPAPSPMEQAAQATGTPPEQAAAMAPAQGGKPPLQMMFAGLTSSGQPNLQSGISRMEPARA